MGLSLRAVQPEEARGPPCLRMTPVQPCLLMPTAALYSLLTLGKSVDSQPTDSLLLRLFPLVLAPASHLRSTMRLPPSGSPLISCRRGDLGRGHISGRWTQRCLGRPRRKYGVTPRTLVGLVPSASRGGTGQDSVPFSNAEQPAPWHIAAYSHVAEAESGGSSSETSTEALEQAKDTLRQAAGAVQNEQTT